MGMNFNFNDGPLPPENVCEPHMPVLIMADNSGSMEAAIENVKKSINRFRNDICKDPKAAERVEICVISFNGDVHILQDWCSITEMKSIELSAQGGTNMSAALRVAVDKLKERGHLYEKLGIEVRMPYLIILTDGKGNNINEIAEEIRERDHSNKMRTWFLGVPGYDKETAAKLTEGKRVFELVDKNGYDFTGFFDVMEVSIKAVSTSSPGEKPVIKEDEDPLNQENCSVKVVDLSEWL